ncbi:MAG: ribosome-associated translation inhibitor RaiA [Bacteroidales bacterium]|jgi:putative sigma-54 modulation protein
MQIDIRSIHFKADRKLEDFIKDRIEKLTQFYDGVIGTEVSLKLLNTEASDNKITEIRLNVRGNDLYAKKQSKSFEESTDEAVEALRRQLIKYKEKVRKS